MTRRFVLTNPDAPLRFDSVTVRRYLERIVEMGDAIDPETGGTPPATVAAWDTHHRDLAGVANQLRGAITADRYTYVHDNEDRP